MNCISSSVMLPTFCTQMCRNGYWACWGEILKHPRHSCVLLCIPESPERETVFASRSCIFPTLWLQWLSGSIVLPLVKCFDVELFIVLCG